MKNYIQLGKEQIAISDETAENLRKQFAEAEPKIRHGDFGVDGHITPFVVTQQRTQAGGNPKAFFANGNGQVDLNGADNNEPNKYGYTVFFNIFDLMAEAMKGEKEYYVQGVTFGLGDDGLINFGNGFAIDSCWRDRFLKAVVYLVIQSKLAEGKK